MLNLNLHNMDKIKVVYIESKLSYDKSKWLAEKLFDVYTHDNVIPMRGDKLSWNGKWFDVVDKVLMCNELNEFEGWAIIVKHNTSCRVNTIQL